MDPGEARRLSHAPGSFEEAPGDVPTVPDGIGDAAGPGPGMVPSEPVPTEQTSTDDPEGAGASAVNAPAKVPDPGEVPGPEGDSTAGAPLTEQPDGPVRSESGVLVDYSRVLTDPNRLATPDAIEALREREPSPGPRPSPSHLVTTVQHEAIPGEGEDAPPLVTFSPGGAVMIGVFDGMGGAGGARYEIDGRERKGAYIGSRLVRHTVAETATRYAPAAHAVGTVAGQQAATAQFTEQLANDLRRAFTDVKAHFPTAPTKIRSAMVRDFPTTAAVAVTWPDLHGPETPLQRRHALSAVWAGDSRIYLLEPARGLTQLTTDDTRGPTDAFESLLSDPPLANCLAATGEFTLNSASWQCEGLCIVLAATDGCFGYLPTPAHFEDLLLSSLTAAASMDDWGARLTDRVGRIAADDATISAVVFGAEAFGAVQRAFAARAQAIAQFVAPYARYDEAVQSCNRELDRLGARRDELAAGLRTTAEGLWARYKADYERLLGTEPPRESP
jgi:hypothetical protein